MKRLVIFIFNCFSLFWADAQAQVIKLDTARLKAVSVSMSNETLRGKRVVRVIKDSSVKEFDQPTFVRLQESHFQNRTIEIKVLSRLLKTAPDYARGFIGVAFRINDSNTKFECIYLRPTNGRAESQLHRNRSVQYFSYPDYRFERLRKEAPGEYETYADMGLNEWITMSIVVKGIKAELFLNNTKQPSLIVSELKFGENISGAVGLWVDIGTEGFFKDLKIREN